MLFLNLQTLIKHALPFLMFCYLIWRFRLAIFIVSEDIYIFYFLREYASIKPQMSPRKMSWHIDTFLRHPLFSKNLAIRRAIDALTPVFSDMYSIIFFYTDLSDRENFYEWTFWRVVTEAIVFSQCKQLLYFDFVISFLSLFCSSMPRKKVAHDVTPRKCMSKISMRQIGMIFFQLTDF